MKFKDAQLSAEAAARKLLGIIKNKITETCPYAYTGVTNSEFLMGGSVQEYVAGRDFAIANEWLKIDDSGTRMFILPSGNLISVS